MGQDALFHSESLTSHLISQTHDTGQHVPSTAAQHQATTASVNNTLMSSLADCVLSLSSSDSKRTVTIFAQLTYCVYSQNAYVNS